MPLDLKQLLRLERTITLVGTQSQIDAEVRLLPNGVHKLPSGVSVVISTIGIAQSYTEDELNEVLRRLALDTRYRGA